MNELIINEVNIENMIYEIRGKQVMLDSDLAKLYKCANGTKTINQAVSRHKNRFPERFLFQLTTEEFCKLKQKIALNNNLWSQVGTTNIVMTRSLPYAFTEQGVAMLATVIKTSVAEEVSIRIMDAFVAMKHYIGSNLIEQKYINNQVMINTENIKLLQIAFEKFNEKEAINEIYPSGHTYDAYSRIVDIFNKAKEELIIIDSYIDKTLLDMINDLKCKIVLITKENNKLKELDITKYNSQYDNLKVIYNDTFHDRYFIIDKETIYHSGTSINHAGLRTFSINVLEDKIVKEFLFKNVNDIIKS